MRFIEISTKAFKKIKYALWFVVKRTLQVPWWIGEVITDNGIRFAKAAKARVRLIAENIKRKLPLSWQAKAAK